MRRSLICLVWLLITVVLGVAVRFAPLHLPPFVWKYLGSLLWAVAVYWLVATVLPMLWPLSLAGISTVIAVLVECTRLIEDPTLDEFRMSLAGQLLLGRVFSVYNILAYVAGIALAMLADARWSPGHGTVSAIAAEAAVDMQDRGLSLKR